MSLSTLTALAKKQNRLICSSVSESPLSKNSSIVVSERNHYETIEFAMGGTDSLDEYAALVIANLERANIKLEIVK